MAINTSVGDITAVVFAFLLSQMVVSSALFPNVSLYMTYQLPPGTNGPEAISFTEFGDGPFTGISDGHIVKLNLLSDTYEYFTYAAPNRLVFPCDFILHVENDFFFLDRSGCFKEQDVVQRQQQFESV